MTTVNKNKYPICLLPCTVGSLPLLTILCVDHQMIPLVLFDYSYTQLCLQLL